MYRIKSEHLNAILQYLCKRPFNEVAHFIQMIQQSEQMIEEEQTQQQGE